ncbi:hypothetical protein FRC04_010177 [Tulasnella sp. 424]|nr:hypothetical protein FRC04_010177 [Tulasnella sp. 424]KAG8972584.1 hypothetical protein FRC05_009817 [Tulasnella sp. 425]
MNAQYDQARALLERRLAQIHTLRSNDKAFHSFGMSLVRRGLPSLQTLEVETDDSHHWENDRADNLPRLRHLASRSWRPPSNAPWLEGLRTLQLRDIRNLSPELYQLLAACTNLRRLLLQLDDPKVGNRFLDLPFVVSFPHLTEVDLDFPDKQTAIIFMSRVKIQPSSGGSVRVRSLSTSELGGAFELFQFLTEGEQSIRPARPTSFRMDGMEMEATYKVGDRSLTLKSVHPWRADGYVDLQRVLESFNQRLNNPPAKITIQEPNSSHALLLPNFSTSNVQSIHFMGTLSFHEVLRQVLRAIGRPQNLCDTRISVSGHAMGDSEDWPFKSLRSLTIESVDGNGRVNLNDVVGLITAGDYKKRGKLGGWLKEVTFIDCILEGMSASDATTRLEALGVIMSIRTRDR